MTGDDGLLRAALAAAADQLARELDASWLWARDGWVCTTDGVTLRIQHNDGRMVEYSCGVPLDLLR